MLFFSFDGCISGIMHSNGVRPLREAQLHNTSGTSEGCLDPCSQTDKCQNGGICRDGVSDVWCDCNGTRFEGTNCTEGRNQSFTYDDRKVFEQNRRDLLAMKPISGSQQLISRTTSFNSTGRSLIKLTLPTGQNMLLKWLFRVIMFFFIFNFILTLSEILSISQKNELHLYYTEKQNDFANQRNTQIMCQRSLE